MSSTSDQPPPAAAAPQPAEFGPEPEHAARPGFGRTPAVRLLVAAATAVVLVWAVIAGVRWWSHPNLLGSWINNGFSGRSPTPLAKSQITFGITYPYDQATPATMTFRSAPVMHFGTNTGHATATFSICYPRPFAGTIGALGGTGRRECRRLVPIVDGTTFAFPSSRAYIVATVTPHTTGTVVMTGADFNYALDRSHWYRRGVDHVGMHVVLKGIY